MLDQWIDCECSDIRSTNKARKRKQLRAIIERRQLIANDTTMARDLMRLNLNMTKQDLLEEGGKRYNPRYLPLKSVSAKSSNLRRISSSFP